MKYFYILLFAIGIHCGSATLRAELYQRITVIVRPNEMVTVNLKTVAMSELIPAIKAAVKGDRGVEVNLCVPLCIKKTELKQILALCREAGVSSFSVSIKQ